MISKFVMRKNFLAIVVGVSLIAGLPTVVQTSSAAEPVATDTRIRTFVYGANEVFRVVTKYGYQSNVEFGAAEEILTISVGDSVAFKVTPSKNRIFIKGLKENVNSNMTVVTNKRAYQFDLSSVVRKEQDIVYVARFYYPDQDFDGRKKRDANLEQPSITEAVVKEQYNFNYSLTGPDYIAPVKVFDDGKFTFFKFPNKNQVIPSISVVSPDGKESIVITRNDGEYVIVEHTHAQFSLRYNDDVVCVFNDSKIPQRM